MVHREIFLDALPVVCTDASVKLLSDVVLGDGLSVRRSHAILKDMHFCNYTTKAMVRHYKVSSTEQPQVLYSNAWSLSLVHTLMHTDVVQ